MCSSALPSPNKVDGEVAMPCNLLFFVCGNNRVLAIYRDTAEYGGQTVCLSLLSVDIKQCFECTSHHDFSFNATIAKCSSAYPL